MKGGLELRFSNNKKTFVDPAKFRGLRVKVTDIGSSKTLAEHLEEFAGQEDQYQVKVSF